MRANPAQTNFTGGEISPRMYGRGDVAKYKNGASILRNCIVPPQGGATRRSGTRLVAKTVLGATKKSRLFSFEFSDEQAYVLEFGEKYIKFFKEGRPLLESTVMDINGFITNNDAGYTRVNASQTEISGYGVYTPLGISLFGTATLSNSGGLVRVTVSVPHGFKTGVKVHVFSTVMPSISNTAFTITRIDNFTFDLQGSTYGAVFAGETVMLSHGLLPGDSVYISGSTATYPELAEKWHVVKSISSAFSFTLANVAYISHGGLSLPLKAYTIPVEIATNFLEADLDEIYIAQSADVLYLCHPRYPTQKLMRLDTEGDRNDWLLTNVTFFDGPYLPLNDLSPSKDTTTPANGSRFVDVYLEISNYAHTATANAIVNFVAGDVNKYVEYRQKDQYRLALVTAQAGATATVSIIDNVLLYLDETIKLKIKADRPQLVPGSSASSQSVNTYRPNYQNGAPGSSSAQRIDNRNGISGASVAGNLTSQFSNTFSQSDVGKFIRYETTANPPVSFWAQIDGVPQTAGTVAHHAASVAMTANNATGKITITNDVKSCTIKAYKNGTLYNMFSSTDTGRMIRLGFGGRWAWGTLTYVSATECTVVLQDELPRDPHNANYIAGNLLPATPNSGITYDWRLGAWSATTGYPSCVCFHEQRLVFGRTATQPQTLFMSRSGDYENMSPTEPDSTVLDDSAVVITLVSGKVSPIKWLYSSASLLIGGLGQEWQVRAASSINDPITPTNISVAPQSAFGSKANVLPQGIGVSTLFVDRHGRKVREMKYNFEIDKFIAVDVSIVAEHILRKNGGAIATEYQKEPINTLWLVLGNGKLATLTYESDHEVTAWQTHEIGGSGIVESIAIESAVGFDRIYLVVKRTIGGNTVRFIEILEEDFEGVTVADTELMPYLDCRFIINNDFDVPVISGLDYLEGETLHVITDGSYIGTKVVTGGAITLTGTAFKAVIGYNFDSLIGILPLEAGGYYGTAQAKAKRVNKLGVRVNGTTSFKSSSVETGTYQLHNLGLFFSGDVRVDLTQNYNLRGEFYIKQDLPEPLNVLLIAPELVTYETV